MLEPVILGLPWALTVGLPWLVLRRRHGRDVATLAALAGLIIQSAVTLCAPDGGRAGTVAVLSALVALNLAAFVTRPRLTQTLVLRARSPRFLIAVTLLFVALVPLAALETGCRALTDLRVLNYHKGIETVWRSGHDDWRLATITGDEHREPDPVLLWRPVAGKPYNSQRFKGPLVKNPKPADVVRIMCFGDSLTDGPPKGGWPSWLQTQINQDPPIAGKRFEVINAGVAGYSSHQGLLRFLQEVDRYQPDLLLVGFGWNDAAQAIGQPDKTFTIPPWPLVICQRNLIRYRSYLVMMYYSRHWRAQPPPSTDRAIQPRVSIDDYIANLDRFRAEAAARSIPIAFLTRAHRQPPDLLSQDPTWRGSVPRYNTALAAWTAQHELALVDVQRAFEKLPETFFSDECHLTAKGYEHMAALIREQIVTAEDSPSSLAWVKGTHSHPSTDSEASVPGVSSAPRADVRR
jgi:lysophospholipase L1-like esterase